MKTMPKLCFFRSELPATSRYYMDTLQLPAAKVTLPRDAE
jgi:hypothetical protein